jgi:hypothetical protein
MLISRRVLALESLHPNRPFGIQQPTLEDHLPSFCGRDVENFLPVGRLEDTGGEFPEIIFTPANAYARTCQATFLLNRVLDHIGHGIKDAAAQRAQMSYFDKTVQAFALFIIEQSNREVNVPWAYSCGAYVICIMYVCHHIEMRRTLKSATSEQGLMCTSSMQYHPRSLPS